MAMPETKGAGKLLEKRQTGIFVYVYNEELEI